MEYAVLMQSDDSVPDASVFTFNDGGGSTDPTLSVQTSDNAKAGDYNLKFTAKYAGTHYTTFSQDFTFTINCQATALTTPSAIADEAYTVFADTLTKTIAEFIPTPACATPVTYSATIPAALSASASFDPATRTFTFTKQTDLSLTTTSAPFYVEYSITVSAIQGTLTQPETFIFKVINPCTITVPADYSVAYSISDPTQTIDLTTSFTSSPADCGTLTRTVTGVSGPVTYNSGTQVISVQSTDTADGGLSIAVQVATELASFTAMTGTTVTITFNISCTAATLALTSGSIAMQEYTIASAAATFTFVAFTASPACAITYAQAAPSTAPITNFDAASRTFTFDEQSDISKTSTTSPYYADYTVTITASSGGLTQDETFVLRVHNPCITSTITVPPNDTINYAIAASAVSQDLSSLAFSGSQPSNLCGTITTTVGSVVSPASYDSGTETLTVYSTDVADAGTTITVTIDSHLTVYPTVTGTQVTITVTIVCTASTLVLSTTPIAMKEYTILDAASSFTFDAFTASPACPITYTQAAAPGTAPITNFDAASRTFTFDEQSDISKTSTTSPYYADYTVTITASSGGLSQDETFVLRVHNPCIASTITVPPNDTINYAIAASAVSQDLSLLAFSGSQPSNLCGTITKTVGSVVSPASYDSGTETLTIYSTDVADAGTTIAVTIDSHLTVYPTVTGTQVTITVTIVCTASTLVLSTTPIAMKEYTILDAASSFTFDAFTASPACPITYTQAAAPGTAPITNFDAASRTFTFDEQSDISKTSSTSPYYADYTVTITASSGGLTQDETFVLRVHNPCIASTITVPPNDTINYAIAASAVSQDLSLLAFSGSQPSNLCGTITKTVGSVVSPASYDSGTETLTVYSTDVADARTTITVTIDSHLTVYPTVTGTQVTITVTIVCTASTLVLSTTPIAMKEYTILDAASSFTFDAFTASPACPITYTQAAAPSTAPITNFDAASRTFTFDEQSDISKTSTTSPYYADYTVTITASSGGLTQDETFVLRVHNPCIASTISVPSDFSQSYVVSLPAETVDLNSLSFTPSIALCGSVTTTLSGVVAPITESSGDLIISTSDFNLVGSSYPVTISSQLATYPIITGSDVTVTVEVTCEATSLTQATPPVDQAYAIGQVGLDYTVEPFVASPACSINYSYTVLPEGAPIETFDVDSRTFTFYEAKDLSISSVNEPYYSDYEVTFTATQGTLSRDVTFQLRVHNPCVDLSLSGVVVPDTLAEVVYHVGDPPTLVDFSTLAFSPVLDICGNLEYTVTGLTSSVTFEAATGVLTIQNEGDTALDGTSIELTVESKLADYPHIQGTPLTMTVSFTATIELDVSFANAQPYFEDSLPSNKTFSFDPIILAAYGVPAPTVVMSLGKLLDLESDELEVSFTKMPDYINAYFESSEVKYTFDAASVKENGSSDLSIVVTERLPDGSTKKQTFSMPFVIEGIPEAGSEEEPFVPIFNVTEGFKGQKPTNPTGDPPSMSIQSVTNSGLLTIRFSDKMIVPSNATELVNSTALEIRLVSANTYLGTLLDFDWSTFKYTENELKINLAFQSPEYVSSDPALLDSVEVKVLVPELFISRDSFKPITEGETVSKELPQQFSQAMAAQIAALEAQAASVQSSSQAALSVNVGVQLALSSSLSLLWGLVNALQIIAHFPMLVINFPANAEVYYNMLLELASLNIIPTDAIAAYMNERFGIDAGSKKEKEAVEGNLSAQVQNAGFESSSQFDNNFSTIFGFVLLAIVLIILGLVYVLMSKCKKGRACTQKVWRAIFWNSILRTIFEKAIEMALASFIRLYALDFSDWKETFSSLFALGQLIVLLVMTFAIPIFLHCKRKQLEEQAFIEKFGSLNLDMKVYGIGPKLFGSFFLFRRLLIASLIVCSSERPWLQIMLMTYSSMSQVEYMGIARPYIESWQNGLELFNEFTILLSCYYVILYSDGFLQMRNPGWPEHDEAIPDLKTRFTIGWANIFTLCSLMIVNIAVMVVLQYQSLRLKCRRCVNKRKQREAIKLRQKRALTYQSMKSLVHDERVPSGALEEPSTALMRPKLRTKKRRFKSQNLSRAMGPLHQVTNDPSSIVLDQIPEVESVREKESSLASSMRVFNENGPEQDEGQGQENLISDNSSFGLRSARKGPEVTRKPTENGEEEDYAAIAEQVNGLMKQMQQVQQVQQVQSKPKPIAPILQDWPTFGSNPIEQHQPMFQPKIPLSQRFGNINRSFGGQNLDEDETSDRFAIARLPNDFFRKNNNTNNSSRGLMSNNHINTDFARTTALNQSQPERLAPPMSGRALPNNGWVEPQSKIEPAFKSDPQKDTSPFKANPFFKRNSLKNAPSTFEKPRFGLENKQYSSLTEVGKVQPKVGGLELEILELLGPEEMDEPAPATNPVMDTLMQQLAYEDQLQQ